MKLQVRGQNLKALRNQDMVAGIIYGKEIAPVKIMIERKEFYRNYQAYGQGAVFSCELNGETHKVYIKDIQRDVMSPEKILNFDLLKVTSTDRIHAKISIQLMHKELLEGKGFMVQQSVNEIDAYYAIDESPEDIVVDVAHLSNGDSIKLSEISLPLYLDVHTDMDLTVVSVSLPRVKEETDGNETESAVASE